MQAACKCTHPVTIFKKRLLHRCFPVNPCLQTPAQTLLCFKNTYFEELEELEKNIVWSKSVYYGLKYLRPFIKNGFIAILHKLCQTLPQWQKPLIKSEKERNVGKERLLNQRKKILSFLELLNNNDLLTWFLFWVCFLKSF